MNPLTENGEIKLITSNNQSLDNLEQWQIDELTFNLKDDFGASNKCLAAIDEITTDWIKGLTLDEWNLIRRRKSLHGVKLPEKWIKVWRHILKEPKLRNSQYAAKGGNKLDSYTYIWNIWSEECIDKYLTNIEKEILELIDNGLLYQEIGLLMYGKYGDNFWKPRKKNSKTTLAQVVNSYLYIKMPMHIARQELTHLVLNILKRRD